MTAWYHNNIDATYSMMMFHIKKKKKKHDDVDNIMILNAISMICKNDKIIASCK